MLSTITLSLALLRWVYFDVARERMDGIFLFFLAMAFLILIIPWENLPWQTLKSVKAGGFELTLDEPQIKGAIDSLGLKRIENERLRNRLKNLDSEIVKINGSRILWIDDRPHNILGERRLLRAFGIEVVMTISSEDAEEILFKDDDFDIIISDVHRTGISYKLNNGVPHHEGVNFIVALRKGYLFGLEQNYMQFLKDGYVDDILKKAFADKKRSLSRHANISKIDEKYWEITDLSMKYKIIDNGVALKVYDENRIINSIPVIFYAAYDWKRLVDNTRPALEASPKETEFCNSIEMLITKTILLLSEARSTPILIKLKKEPTPAA